jgi:murein hydrolase activator
MHQPQQRSPFRRPSSLPVLALLGLLAAALPAVSALAAPENAADSRDPEAIRKALEASRERAAALEAQESELNQELAHIRETLATNALLLQARENERRDLMDRIGDLEARLSIAQARLDERRGDIARLLGGLQKLSMVPPEALLSSARTIPELSRAAIVMRNAIPALQEQLEPLRAEVATVEELREKIEGRRLELASLSAELGRQDKQLTRLLDERSSRLQSTTEDHAAEAARVEALARKAADLQALMRDLKQLPEAPAEISPAGANRPRLLLPVAGTVVRQYGGSLASGARSEGLVLAAASGQVVLAPGPGTIRYAGEFRRYGQLVIVEHEGEYHSILAGPLAPLVEVGQSVNAGEPLARLDPAVKSSNSLLLDPVSGSNSGDLPLYFETRYRGRPVNPRPLIAASRTLNRVNQ